jgi:hypothetical protein
MVAATPGGFSVRRPKYKGADTRLRTRHFEYDAVTQLGRSAAGEHHVSIRSYCLLLKSLQRKNTRHDTRAATS